MENCLQLSNVVVDQTPIDCSIMVRLYNEKQLHRVEDQRVPLMVIFQMDSTNLKQISTNGMINLMVDSKDLPVSHTVLLLHESSTGATVTLMERHGLVLVNQSNISKPFHISPGQLQVPFYLKDAVIADVLVIYGTTNGEQGFYYNTKPVFENICGSMQVERAVRMDYLASPDHPWGAILRKSKTAFGICYELFTIHGNITLRAGKDGGMMVSIKGTRDMEKIYKTLGVVMGSRFVNMCKGIDDADDTYSSSFAGFFSVHMAVITSCVGKRMSVFSGCVLERLLLNILGPEGVSIIPGLSEETNSLKLSILSWEKVIKSVAACNTIDCLEFISALHNIGDVGDNTISITSKGCVIVRFSWKKAISWDKNTEATLTSMCTVLNSLIRECC
jgi:hypothetical protein